MVNLGWFHKCGRSNYRCRSGKPLFYPHCRLEWSCEYPKSTPTRCHHVIFDLPQCISAKIFLTTSIVPSPFLPPIGAAICWMCSRIEDGTIVVIQVQEIPPNLRWFLGLGFLVRMFSLLAIKRQAWNMCSFIHRAILTSTSVFSWQIKNVQASCKSCWVNKN